MFTCLVQSRTSFGSAVSMYLLLKLMAQVKAPMKSCWSGRPNLDACSFLVMTTWCVWLHSINQLELSLQVLYSLISYKSLLDDASKTWR